MKQRCITVASHRPISYHETEKVVRKTFMKKVLLPSTESEEEPPVPTTESEEEPPVPTIESEEEPLFGEEDEVTPFEVLRNVEPEEPDVEYISSRES